MNLKSFKKFLCWLALILLSTNVLSCSIKERKEFFKKFKENKWRIIVEGRGVYQDYVPDEIKFKPIQNSVVFKERPDFFSLNNFDISPDGKNIVFSLNNFKNPNDIILADHDFANPEILVRMQGASNPTWSLDGKKISFTAIPNSADRKDLAQTSLFLYEVTTKNLKLLVKDNVSDFSGYDNTISWHPDNRTIFFASRDEYIKKVDIDSQEVKTLCKGVYPKISPDGSRLIFRKNFRDNDGTLKGVIFYLLNLNTNKQSELIGGVDSVNWSPDGNYLLIISFYSDFGDSHKAEIMNFNNRKLFTLCKYDGYEAVSWGFQPQ